MCRKQHVMKLWRLDWLIIFLSRNRWESIEKWKSHMQKCVMWSRHNLVNTWATSWWGASPEHLLSLRRAQWRRRLSTLCVLPESGTAWNWSVISTTILLCITLFTSLSLLCRLKSQRMKEQSQSGDSFSPGGRGRLSLPVSWLCLILISASQLLLYTGMYLLL